MSLSDDERSALVNLYMQRAYSTLEDAEVAIQARKWSMAANRLYYASFHAISALFVSDGRSVGTHRGVKASLGHNYVLTGELSSESAKYFARLETLRDKADYNILFEVKEDIVPNFHRAKEFVAEIERLLKVKSCN